MGQATRILLSVWRTPKAQQRNFGLDSQTPGTLGLALPSKEGKEANAALISWKNIGRGKKDELVIRDSLRERQLEVGPVWGQTLMDPSEHHTWWDLKWHLAQGSLPKFLRGWQRFLRSWSWVWLFKFISSSSFPRRSRQLVGCLVLTLWSKPLSAMAAAVTSVIAISVCSSGAF